MKINLAEAQRKLPELVRAVENGEKVTIRRRGTPAVDLVRSPKYPRKPVNLGTARGKIKVLDPDWWKPMSDKEADDFLEGRY